MPFIFILHLLGVFPTPAEAAIVSPLTVEYSTTTAPFIMLAYASRYGIDADRFIKTAECESHFVPQQSRIPHKGGPRGREDSWGVFQINLPAHLDVSRAQAMDPWFAIEWSAKEWAAGRQDQWTCYRNLFPEEEGI